MPRPARFVVDESDGRLIIDWRWFQLGRLGLIPFAVVWWIFLVLWFRGALARPSPEVVRLLFPLVHVAIGISVLHAAIANLVNRTRIVADDAGLTVRHGPLPWPGKRIDRSSLSQLFCEALPRGRNGATFALAGAGDDGKRVRIVGGFTTADEPRWLEAALGKRLGIRDRPVVGELDAGRLLG